MDYTDVRVLLDQWHAYPFPNEQAAIRFAYGCLTRGSAVKLEAHMAGKSLYPAGRRKVIPGKSLRSQPVREVVRVSEGAAAQKRGLPVLAPLLTMQEADTYFVVQGNTFMGMVTIMADGCEVAWDACASCTNHVRMCKCRFLTPSRAVQTIAYKTAGVKRGEKWEEVSEPKKPTDDTPRQIVYPWREKSQKKSLYPTSKKPAPPKSQPPAKGKPLRAAIKPKKKEPTIEVDSNFKLSSLDSAAAKSAGDAMAALGKRLVAGRKSLHK